MRGNCSERDAEFHSPLESIPTVAHECDITQPAGCGPTRIAAKYGDKSANTLAVFGGPRARSAPYPVWPCPDPRDEEAICRVVRSGRWGGYPYPGPETAAFLEEFLAFQGGDYAVACVNGTVTLELALRAAGIGWGDEVIVPAYSFQATAIAPINIGSVPVFVDIDPNTYCIDLTHLERSITGRTKAIIVVHLGQQMARMHAIRAIAERHDLILVEDAAHAHGAQWNSQGAGTIGHFGSFSLQSSKLLAAGEGGILVCRTAEMAQRAASIADNGRPFAPGGKRTGGNSFTFGTNLRMTELQSALARVGLIRLPEQTRQREETADYLDDQLATIPGVRRLERHSMHTRRSIYCYMFAISPEIFGFDHDVFCHFLKGEGIPCWTGYPAIHRSPAFQPRLSRLPAPSAYPEAFTYDSTTAPHAERAGSTEAVWLNEQVFRAGMAGIDDLITALRKIHTGRHIIAARQHELVME